MTWRLPHTIAMAARGLLCAACLLSTAAAESPQKTTYDVGVARVDVTPGYPVRLHGFGGRRAESEGVTQRIWAKALALGSDQEQPAILLAVDNLGMRESMIDEVARRLHEKAGVRRERIVATFTHTHTAPKVNGSADTIFSSPIPPEHQAHIDRYTQELTDALEQAALAALADRKPATLSWAVGNVGFAKNRRTAGGPVDHDLPILVVKSAADDAIRAIYATYACHCVTLSDNKISGDWAGYAQEAIERTHPGVTALISIGCGSDSNPDSGVTGSNTAAAADQGDQIRAEVDRLLAGTLKPVTGSLSAVLSHIDLPLAEAPTRDQLEERAKQEGAEGYNARYQLARLDRGEALVDKLHYPVQTLAFGDSLVMVFLAGEVCVDYSLRLKQELDASRLWLHGYSNDFCAYIPSERLLKEGGYGGGGEIHYFALPTTLRPGLEDRIIAEVHRQVPDSLKLKSDAQRQSNAERLRLQRGLNSIQAKQDFVVEVAAAEPLVADPVAIDFGPCGRLWVAEMPDYTRDVDDQFTPSGNIRALADRDGDGRYDHSAVFAQGLRFPTDVKAWRRGVIVCDAPDVIYFEDADGDGQADRRTVLITGFDASNPHARVNSLRWGLDNWLYGSGGLLGGHITTHTGRELALGNRDFRFRPDTGEIEGVTGYTQQGRTRNDWGDWFGCENGTLMEHYPLTDRYMARNPRVAPPPTDVFVPVGEDPNQLHPIGAPSLFALSGPPGRPTSACGLEIYRDDLLGAEYAGNAFVAEPVNNLVHRRVLSAAGSSFQGARAADEQDVEFLASTETRFRPVQIRTGLDGCLYVVDMHREIIEHPKFIPPQALAGRDVMGGRDEGRIYRIRPRGRPPRPAPRLDRLAAAGLAAALDSPNGPQRDLAQQLLVERRAVEAAPALGELVRRAPRPATRLQALCALDGLQAVDAEILSVALADEHPAVRRHAIRISEPLLKDSPRLAEAVIKLAGDDDPQVRLQLAYTLGEAPAPAAAPALAQLAIAGQADPYLLSAVWSSIGTQNVAAVAEQIIAHATAAAPPATAANPNSPPRSAPSAATTAAAQRAAGAVPNSPPRSAPSAANIAAAQRAAGAGPATAAGINETVIATAVDLLVDLGDASDVAALAGKLPTGPPATWKMAAAARLFEHHRTAGVDAAPLAEQLAPIIAQARHTLQDPAADEPAKLAAIQVVAAGQPDRDSLLPLFEGLLGPQNGPAVRQAAIEQLAANGSSAAAEMILASWRGFTAELRAAAFDAMIGDDQLAKLLLAKLSAGDVQPNDLDALQRQRLTEHADAAIRAQARQVVAASVDVDRQQLIAQYAAAAEHPGDAAQGRKLFGKHCSSCHRLEGAGHAVGPDLAALSSREPTALLQSILDPNRDIDQRYRSYTAITADGLSHAGILAGETSTSVTLLEQQGKQRTLLRADLELFESSGKSLMPEGLERDVSAADAADLIAYITAAGPPPKAIEGNRPTVVTPDYDGTLWLLAASAEIYGGQITFEQPYQNIGYWHGQNDYVAWQVEHPTGGQFEVILHWACADDTAANRFAIDGLQPPVINYVGATGGYDRFNTVRLGYSTLRPGRSRVVVRPDGPLATHHLMDLCGVYLVPRGTNCDRALAGEAPTSGPDAAVKIVDLLQGLAVGTPAEYERIPAIWEEALAAGRRDAGRELVRLLDLALPQAGEPLRDWQAVVVGGGIVNGLSQLGKRPGERLAELLKPYPQLQARWQRTIELAWDMADDAAVANGTRYDALRILGADVWERGGVKLQQYLGKDVHAELQMGAVSGLMDLDAPEAAAAVLAHFSTLQDGNQRLAIDLLMQSPQRRRQLAAAIAAGQIPADRLAPHEQARLHD
ncbi:MAG: dehydrogenase [Planctomycetota bacterium]|nr:MAG: dehydrogenase [Planctomycetota bacterium]